MTPTAERWIAARDGIGHYRRPREPRTVCGLAPIERRWAWPERERCRTCVRLAVAEAADFGAVR